MEDATPLAAPFIYPLTRLLPYFTTFSPFAVRGVCTCRWVVLDSNVTHETVTHEMGVAGCGGLSSQSTASPLEPPTRGPGPGQPMISEVHAPWRFTALHTTLHLIQLKALS